MRHRCLVGLLAVVILAGCAAFQADRPATGDGQAQTEGQKNLAAIRAMIADERRRVHELRRSPEQPPAWPPDWYSSYSAPYVPRSDPDLAARSRPRSSAPQFGRTSPSPDVTARIPWAPDPPTRPEIEPTRPVPPYTTVVPPGPFHPGRMRCVPDMLGGQRCQAE